MENLKSELDLKNLVAELSQGRELAKQLRAHLNAQSSSSYENREALLQRILYSYDHALSMLAQARPGDGGGEMQPMAASDSPRSLVGSPGSDDSDQDLKDPASRKRKTVARWSKKIKVSPGEGIERQLDDGYGWRKYGQKDILGAKYPRGYYRCTYRHAQGCLATKLVQRSDDDHQTTFEITYRRRHTCNPRADTVANAVNPPAPTPDPQNVDPNPLTQNEPLFNIQTSLRVITQDLNTNENPSNFQPFNFSSSVNPQDNPVFPYGDIMGDYNSISANDSDDYGGLISNLLISDSELSPIVAAMTSTTNSPTLGTDFPFNSSGFGFGDPRYYP